MKAITPSQQGEFDGACGFYAVVNAISLVYPRVDRSALFHYITRGHAPFLLRGTGRNQLNAILRRAEEFMRRSKVAMPIHIDRPFWKTQPTTLDAYWDTLRRLEKDRRIPIIGYEFKQHIPKGKADAHWSVVRKVTPKNLLLHDSDGTKRIARSRSQRLGEKALRPYCLDTTATFVVSRDA